ncbi:hypothetical protein N7452_010021 [Penicillium brevicompactum]|uniref:Uncharacterized protein n=1 Tax=Penicillium brevicompactum TaxID=5074 RepID=A0A9W9UAT8_PENBR|nr:hypothetical protein N7452_010021 [Penicillium brevicompactum]
MASGPQFLPEVEPKVEVRKAKKRKAKVLKDAATQTPMPNTYFEKTREDFFDNFATRASQASNHRPPSASDTVVPTPQQHSNEMARTIFYGAPSGKMDHVTAVQCIRSAHTQAIYEVVWHGKPAIAKCLDASELQRFRDFFSTYLKLYQKRPAGFRVFPSFYAAGTVCCSSLFPSGYVLVLAKMPGTPLKIRWNELPEWKQKYIQKLKFEGSGALRSIGVVWKEPAHVLFSGDERDPRGFLLL